MILKGSQRSGAGKLAKHLLKTTENEHVEVHDIRGFIADRLDRALEEIYAISRGTKCSQFMFSLSLNPPEEEDVPVEVFEAALARIENALGLTGQPRVVVFHEKKGRRHAHCVWSRIRASTMTAINLPHFKRKLSDISKQLYLEHGWKLPNGFKDGKKRDPLNFTLEEWQQAHRQKRDPRELKTLLQTCWKQANSRRALERALEDNGFFLAQGDRRGYVALSAFGDVYALRRWIGVRTKELEAKLGSPDQLRSVTLTRQLIAERMKRALDRFAKGFTEKAIIESKAAREQRNALTAIHNKQRELLDKRQAKRREEEMRARQERLPRGITVLWWIVTGRYFKVRKQNEQETALTFARDRTERQQLIQANLKERRKLRDHIASLKAQRNEARATMTEGQAFYSDLAAAPAPERPDFDAPSRPSPTPRRTL